MHSEEVITMSTKMVTMAGPAAAAPVDVGGVVAGWLRRCAVVVDVSRQSTDLCASLRTGDSPKRTPDHPWLRLVQAAASPPCVTAQHELCCAEVVSLHQHLIDSVSELKTGAENAAVSLPRDHARAHVYAIVTRRRALQPSGGGE